MADYISREALIAFLQNEARECQESFEELGGESGIVAETLHDLIDDIRHFPAAEVEPARRGPLGMGADGELRAGGGRSMKRPTVYCFECQLAKRNSSSGALKCTSLNGLHRTVGADEFCSWGEKGDMVMDMIPSAEKQAIFRLGQMDMCDSMAAMLRDAGMRSRGTIKADFMAAADLVAEREIP